MENVLKSLDLELKQISLKHKNKYINQGGCCLIAMYLYQGFKYLKIPAVPVVISYTNPELNIIDISKKVNSKLSNGSLPDFGIIPNHIMIQYGGNIYFDIDGMYSDFKQVQSLFCFSIYKVAFLTENTLRAAIRNKNNDWSRCFNRNHAKEIENDIYLIFKSCKKYV